MKKIIYAVAVVALLIVAFYGFNAYIYHEKQGDGNAVPEGLMVTRTGTVAEVLASTDGAVRITALSEQGETFFIALPSQAANCSAADNLPIAANIASGDRVMVRGFVARDGTVVPCESPAHYVMVTGLYQSGKLGLRFSYNKGVDGYVLATTTGEGAFVERITLTEAAAMAEGQSEEAQEGPPTITISVYDNELRQSAAVWASENPDRSLISRILGESEEVVVGGANAVRFTADGLYASVVHVVAHDTYQYVIAGEYLDEESSLAGDYRTLVDALTFIPITE